MLSAIHVVLALGFFIAHRRDIVPTLTATFRRIERESIDDD